MRKTIFLSLLLVLSSIWTVSAQKKAKAPEQSAQQLSDKMAEVMKLDDATKEQVYQINLSAAKQMSAIQKEIREKYPNKADRKANKDAIKEAYRPERKRIQKERKAALKALDAIGKEEWAAWKAYRKEQKAAPKEKKGKKSKKKGKGSSDEDLEDLLGED